eukprot:TRINITY_DN94946_c0_g1_i4.p1 TRINITY_DN94946_c0_g1~~TRINITY_DN94946_c0_g1_i4.p1  ORF type:complete len:388 (+),score=55.13 TRINITY_DN94946_c0_g1_i4:199-1362(+)
MGQSSSKEETQHTQERVQGITAGYNTGQLKLPQNVIKADESDYALLKGALANLLLFQRVDDAVQTRIVAEMYVRQAKAGEILIKQGDIGIAASELYVVKHGKFEVLENRHGTLMQVNTKEKGDCFGEISLMYNCPRSATVAAQVDSSVWVLERQIFRYFVREIAENDNSQIELFLNSVPLLSSLSRGEKLALVDAFEEVQFAPGTKVLMQGAYGDLFYIIKDGEAAVYEQNNTSTRKVNHLFKADFFGEMSLLNDAPRKATVEATTKLTCLTLRRATFNQILGPLSDIMQREKSEDITKQRLGALEKRGTASRSKPGMAIVKRTKFNPKTGAEQEEVVKIKGHQDEINSILGIMKSDDTEVAPVGRPHERELGESKCPGIPFGDWLW